MESQSIHPSVVKGKTKHEKVNTAKPYKNKGGKLAKKQARLNSRRNAHSATIKDPKNALAFKAPGSMKQGS